MQPNLSARFATAMGVAVLLCVMIVGLVLWNAADPPAIDTVTRIQPAGRPEPLFDGLNVPLLRKTGLWQVADAQDGSRVLRGAADSQIRLPFIAKGQISLRDSLRPGGESRREIRPASRLEIDIWLADQSRVTIGVDETDPSLRLSSTELQWNNVDVPNQSLDPDQSAVHLHFDQVDDAIQVWTNGRFAGSLPLGDAITIRCETGTCDLSDIQTVKLTPKP